MKVRTLRLSLSLFNDDADVKICTREGGELTILSIYSEHARPVAEHPGRLGSPTDKLVYIDVE